MSKKPMKNKKTVIELKRSNKEKQRGIGVTLNLPEKFEHANLNEITKVKFITASGTPIKGTIDNLTDGVLKMTLFEYNVLVVKQMTLICNVCEESVICHFSILFCPACRIITNNWIQIPFMSLDSTGKACLGPPMHICCCCGCVFFTQETLKNIKAQIETKVQQSKSRIIIPH